MPSEAVCVAFDSVGKVHPDQRSMDDRTGVWQDLEHFWGDEKQRLKDCDGQDCKKQSSSLEEQLMFEECINEPAPTCNENKYDPTVELTPVFGREIKDIPTSYMIGGFQPHELIVIGTYVDSRIHPGFRYKVRKNRTREHLFGGRALVLETVGQGYGKRLTFRGGKLNENPNFFWSDSRNHGFGFVPQCLEPGAVFAIDDATTGQRVGRVLVRHPEPDVELDTRAGPMGRVQKRVEVRFGCDVVLECTPDRSQELLVEGVEVRGEALLVRDAASTEARVLRVVPGDGFVVDGCLLVPE